MKKLLSALFSIFVIAAICVAVYFNQQFALRQLDKVKGMYYVYKGDKAYSQMNMQDAIGYYNRGLDLYPQHYSAWYNLGNIYVAYEDYHSALYAYSQAFKHNPRMMIARMNYGIIASERLGDFDTAIEQYRKVIDTKRTLLSIPYVYDNRVSFVENKAIAYYNIGVTYRLKSLYANEDWEARRKSLSKAIEAYQHSVELNPNNYDAQYNLGVAYHTVGDYERAGRCYCKAINSAPMNYEAHYNLALLLKKLKHYKEAYEEIDKATTLITALDGNSATQQYVAMVMNDITRNLHQNPEYRRRLEMILEDEKRKTAQHMVKDKKELKSTLKKEDKIGETITSKGINFVNGKIVATEELDQAMLENFGKCSAEYLFNRLEEDY